MAAEQVTNAMVEYEDIDDLLPIVGGFGRFQKRIFAYSLIFNVFFGWVYLSQVFLSTDAPHWCAVPELEGLSLEQQKNLSIPFVKKDGETEYSQCKMYNVNYTQVLAENLSPSADWPVTYCKSGWNYDYSVYYPTIVTEENWVCDEDWRPAFAQSMFFAGAIVGTLVFGYLADKYGRRPVLIAANMCACAGGVATAFSSGFATFITFRFFVGMAYDLHYVMIMIIVQEYITPEKRTVLGQLPLATITVISEATVSLIASSVFNWRIYCIITSAPLIIVLLAPCITPKSPRWMLGKRRVTETVNVLRKIAKINKKEVDDVIFSDFERCMAKQLEEFSHIPKPTTLDLVKTPNMRRRTLIMAVVWMIITMVFDASVRFIPEVNFNPYYLWTLNQLPGVPGNLLSLVAMNWLGRRWMHVIALICSGALFFIMPLIDIDNTWTIIGMCMLARFFLTMVLNGGLQYLMELLPTVLRGRGTGLIHIMGHVSTFFAPFIVYVMQSNRTLGYGILAACSVAGGLLCLLLPETAGERLPQTVDEGEKFGEDQSFCFCPFHKSKTDDNNGTVELGQCPIEGVSNEAFYLKELDAKGLRPTTKPNAEIPGTYENNITSVTEASTHM